MLFKKNVKQLTIVVIVLLHLIPLDLTGMSRLNQFTGANKLPLAPIFTQIRKSHILPNQTEHPLLQEANKSIANFLKKWGLPPIEQSQIDTINQNTNDRISLKFAQYVKRPLTQEETNVQTFIKKSLQKHSINSKAIPIIFIGKNNTVKDIGIKGTTILINDDFFKYSPEEKSACIEAQICHLMYHDDAHLKAYESEFIPYLLMYYEQLLIQRSLIYSGIQSKENTINLPFIKKSSSCLKMTEVLETLRNNAPEIEEKFIRAWKMSALKNKLLNLVNICIPNIRERILPENIVLSWEELFKQLENEITIARTNGKLTDQKYETIMSKHKSPTYYQQLLSFHEKQSNTKDS